MSTSQAHAHISAQAALLVNAVCFTIGSIVVKAAAASSGVVQIIVQLLQEDQSSRLAYEAADLLTMLTSNNTQQQSVMAQDGTLQGLLDLTRKLLQASDALSDSTAGMDAYPGNQQHDGIAASVELAVQNAAVTSQLSSLKVGSNSDFLLSSTLDKPRVSWSASSLSIAPGSPAILTLPNGQHSECAIPKSPLGVAESDLTGLSGVTRAAAASAADMTSNRGGFASTSAPTQPPTPVSRTSTKSLSIRNSPSRTLSATLSSSWIGGLMKRLGSSNKRDPSQDSTCSQSEFGRQDDRSTTLSPFASLANSPTSSSVQNQFARSQSLRSDTLQPNSARVMKKTYQPRHPSQSLLRAIITAIAHLVEGNPGHQGTVTRLGALPLAQDVLTLAGKVGPRGGLVGAGADFVRCLSDSNPPAQQALGCAGCVGQLLSLLQVCIFLTFTFDSLQSVCHGVGRVTLSNLSGMLGHPWSSGQLSSGQLTAYLPLQAA